jgi:hypothetical protein
MYDIPQKLVLIELPYEIGLSVCGAGVGVSVGRKVGWWMMSSLLHVVAAQHVSPSSHSSSVPPGHHLGLPPSSQLADASTQVSPQNLKFCGSS